jgi:RND family efflux transporter MFP subunit
LRHQRQVDADAAEASAAAPRIAVAVARGGALDTERMLPGNALPLLEAAIYPRTTGYVKSRLVDIGDPVKEGQLLAVIAAPDIDDQLAKAKADLTLAQANMRLAEADAELARSTFERTLQSGVKGAASAEDVDQARAAVKKTAAQVDSTRASIQVHEATVKRFTDLQGFQKITAPFRGVITSRNVDPGDLVTADNPGASRELFHLMRTDILRVFVNVPQFFAPLVKVGKSAVVYRREDPHKQHPSKVTRTADALDPNTRTLLTEVQVPNPENNLRPGMYLQVKFVFDRTVVPVLIPAAALATRAAGPRVAVLDDQQRVHYRNVQLWRDLGATIEVISGLNPGDRVVVHPGDDLPEGTVVEPVLLPP